MSGGGDKVQVCPRCGSTHFYDAEFRQYYAGFSSASAGGELYAVPRDPQRVRICTCGEPLEPAGRSASAVRQSVRNARQYRAHMQPEALRAELAARFAQKHEWQQLEKKLAALEEVQRRLDEQHLAKQLKAYLSTAEPDKKS